MPHLNSRIFARALVLSLILCAAFFTFIHSEYNAFGIPKEDTIFEIPEKDLNLFGRIFTEIKKNYVSPVENISLFEGAVNGMIKQTESISSTDTRTLYKNIWTSGQAKQSDEVTKAGIHKPIRLFTEIYTRIMVDTKDIESMKEKNLIESAIHGMLATLDPYSKYLTKREYEDLKISTAGKFGGLGIVIQKKGDYIRVIETIKDTPAERAKLQAKDKISQIDDTLTADLKLTAAVDLMRGKVGSPVELTVIREGIDKPFKVNLVRAIIKRESVRYVLLGDDILYLNISNFQNHTGKDLRHHLNQIKLDKTHKPIKGMILDLRSNPGGVLKEAVAVSDVFLNPNHLVVYTKGRIQSSKLEFKTKTKAFYGDVPFVVLINGRSASASEIVAGALKDHQRAVIMGSQSFGKASVQTVTTIDKHSALKLTTAQYYTPNGYLIHGEGIVPDIVLAQPSTSMAVTTDKNKSDEKLKQHAATQAAKKKEDDEATLWLTFEERVKKNEQIKRAVEELRNMTKVAKSTP